VGKGMSRDVRESLLAGGDVPDEQIALLVGAGQDLAVGAEGRAPQAEARSGMVQPFEDGASLPRGRIPDVDIVLPAEAARGSQAPAVRAEDDLLDRLIANGKSELVLPRRRLVHVQDVLRVHEGQPPAILAEGTPAQGKALRPTRFDT